MGKNKYGVIMPLHEYNEDYKVLVERAVSSVPSNVLFYVICGGNVNEDFVDLINNLRSDAVLINFEGTNFSSLVNHGMTKLKEDGVEWVYILEFDDEFNSLWFDEVSREIKDKPDVSVFLPLTEIVDYNNNKFISYGNEAPWASSFSSEIGYIDNESLQQFFDFYLTGSVFNTKDWAYVGGLKESFKLTFWYEFLLRLTHNDKKAYVVPKLGYKHYVNRPNSLYSQYKSEINEEEGKWWYDLALEEYAYKKDRKKEYNKD